MSDSSAKTLDILSVASLTDVLRPAKRPIYAIRFVSYTILIVCDRINTRTNVMFQISPVKNEQKMWYQHSLSYVRMTVVYGKSYGVDRPAKGISESQCSINVVDWKDGSIPIENMFFFQT